MAFLLVHWLAIFGALVISKGNALCLVYMTCLKLLVMH